MAEDEKGTNEGGTETDGAPPPEQVEGGVASTPEVAPESVEEVVPEEVSAPRASARVMSHHPPPPPRVRSSAASAARPIQVTGDPKLARDLMTRQLFTIGPDDPIAKLEGHMVKFHFRHLPVVSGEKVVGLISHADLLQAASSVLSTSAEAENAVIGKLPASRIMQRDLVTARPDETLSAVAERLWATRAEAILVTEEDGTLVGILTERDFVRMAHHLLASGKTDG